MAKCFNPTCNCKDLQIVREIILRCSNCHCAVKVEETPYGCDENHIDEDLLFTVTKNAE